VARPVAELEVGEPPPEASGVLGRETHPTEEERVVARDSEALNTASAQQEMDRQQATKELGGARAKDSADGGFGCGDEAVSEAARLRAEVPALKDERLLAGRLPGVRESTHPTGKAWVEALEDKKGPLRSAVEELAKEVSEADGGSTLAAEVPRLEQRRAVYWKANYCAPSAGLPYLRKSTLPGAQEAAQRLQPPSTSAGGGPASMLLASGARARDGKGNPLAVLFPRDAHGQSPLLLGGESWLAQDRGQHIGDLGSQCVLLVLAHALGVAPADLHARGVVEAKALLQTLGPLPDSLSLEELGARQCAHDFLHRNNHDFFLTRYFFRNAVAPQSSSAWVLRKGSCASR